MDLNDLNFATNSGSNTAGADSSVSSSQAAALTSLLQGSQSEAQKQGILMALLNNQQQTQAPPSRGVSRSNSGASALSAFTNTQPQPQANNDSALRTLLLLSQQTQPQPPPQPSAAVDLQGQLARLRAAPGLEGLLASAAAPPQPPPPPRVPTANLSELLRLRAAMVSGAAAPPPPPAAPQRTSTENLLEQARIFQAINTHQQALANVGEAERRLTLLLGGSAGTLSAANTTAPPPAPVLLEASPLVTAPPPSAPPAAGLSDAQKLAALEQLGNPKKCMPCLPPVEEGNTTHHSQRTIVPLGTEEDPNWLSERQCFIRSDLLEVVRASHEEVLVRSSSKSIAYQQVGIRCRYCAHLPAGSRAIRASAFPSSIRQMYQSFTMMVRDHFGNCIGVPPEKKQRFLKLKGLTSPSSSLSRQYWAFAAKKLGMRDSEYGIMINEESQAEAHKIPPFGTTAEEKAAIQAAMVELLVEERDQNSISPYLYFLMNQAQMVSLLPSERVGKRKDAAVGLPGFGCIHCAKAGRLGFCRMFPLNKRSLPDKVNDLYNHMMRCPQCPRMTKRLLESRRTEQETNRIFAERDRDFIDRIWIKLGRDCDDAFKKKF